MSNSFGSLACDYLNLKKYFLFSFRLGQFHYSIIIINVCGKYHHFLFLMLLICNVCLKRYFS